VKVQLPSVPATLYTYVPRSVGVTPMLAPVIEVGIPLPAAGLAVQVYTYPALALVAPNVNDESSQGDVVLGVIVMASAAVKVTLPASSDFHIMLPALQRLHRM
jgi:hypothetical protein